MTDVTIRGIDDQVYSLFSAEARRRGVLIGELVTQVMRIYLEETAEKLYTIEDVDELTITKEELESVGGPIAFKGVKTLTIDSDIDWETFDKHVVEIRKSRAVIIPHTLSKLQVLTKCKSVGDIISRRHKNQGT